MSGISMAAGDAVTVEDPYSTNHNHRRSFSKEAFEMDDSKSPELATTPSLEGSGHPGVQKDVDVAAESTLKPLSPYVIVPIWILLSGGIILFNKHIFSTLDFPYPVFMTAYHMCVATIGTRVLDRLPFERFQTKPTHMNRSTFMRTIVPLSLLYSTSLISSNVAYVHLSVSFVQMMKAFTPILFIIIQILAGLTKINYLLISIVLVTTLGCMIAAAGEIRFSMFGFLCQVLALITESTRLVLLHVMLKDFKMDPLTSVSMFAPVCAMLIGACLPFREGLNPFREIHKVGYPALAANGLVAFSLNIASFLLIGSAGALVSALSGVIKDILLISIAFVMGTPITLVQTAGYTIAISGLMSFKYTGGEPNSVNGTRFIRFFQDLSATPLAFFQQANLRPGRKLGSFIASAVVLFLTCTLYLYPQLSTDVSSRID